MGPRAANNGKNARAWGTPEEVTGRAIGMFHHILCTLQAGAKVDDSGEAAAAHVGWISTRTHRYYIDERGISADILLATLNSAPKSANAGPPPPPPLSARYAEWRDDARRIMGDAKVCVQR